MLGSSFIHVITNRFGSPRRRFLQLIETELSQFTAIDCSLTTSDKFQQRVQITQGLNSF